ncbi:MAG: aminopeptidase P family protein [Verrucomicrobiales bacterium]
MTKVTIDRELFISNRKRLAEKLKPNSLATVNSNDVLPTNADGTLALVPNSDLFYLTGIEQEESMLLIYPDADDESHREILFLREPIKELELWEGHKLTREEAQEISGIKNIQWLPTFQRLFHRLMCECEHVYLNSNEHKRAVISTQTREARFVRQTMETYPLHDYQRLAPLMHRLRVVKSKVEVDLIQRAANITGQGFDRVVRMVQPGVNEKEVEAEFAYEFTRNHGRFAYLPIIATGKNACALHYIKNDDDCKDGDLLLIDVAATHRNYNADMTRTIPVNGKYSRRQREIYNAVLRVLRFASDGLKPGKKWKEWQKETEQLIERECVDLGLLKMSQIKKQDPGSPAVKKFFMHGVGHPLGLDVHDVGLITEPMQEGWVMTVEPAIYLPEEGFAVRLENDVVIGAKQNIDLMAHIPIEAEEIEELMSKRKGRGK